MSKLSPDYASVTRVGLDLAKTVFQVHAVDASGNEIDKRAIRRAKLLDYFAALPPVTIGMEACSSAHHWARVFEALGHKVMLIPPIYVKPFVRRQKTDAADAAAICEAMGRPGMRCVPVRSIENQAAKMVHSVRETLSGQRTQLMNALRGHLAEAGVIAAQGHSHVRKLAMLVERAEDWPWSSTRALIAGVDDHVVKVGPALERVGDFAAFLGEEFDEALTYAALRKAESVGRPIGSKEWLAEMEERTGMKLAPAKRGPKSREP